MLVIWDYGKARWILRSCFAAAGEDDFDHLARYGVRVPRHRRLSG